jgi:hypothetical protein
MVLFQQKLAPFKLNQQLRRKVKDATKATPFQSKSHDAISADDNEVPTLKQGKPKKHATQR